MERGACSGWITAVIALSLLAFFGTPTECRGQYVEVYAVVQQMIGDTTTGLGMPVEVDDSVVGGVGAGMNIDGFNLNLDFLFGSTDITMGEAKVDSKLFCVDANLDYSVLRRWLSPMVTAGIGSVTFTDSHVSADEFNETDFSYNIGAGLRLIVKERLLLKAIYRTTWTKIKDTDDSIMFDGVSASFGYIF